VVLAVVGLRRHLSPAVALLLVAIAALPFALLTWWSIVSPLIAVLLFAHAIAALRPAGRVGRGGVAMPRGGGLR
jgi:hypothetical protein